MEIRLKNLKQTIRGIDLFGIIITTRRAIQNAKYEADEVELKSEVGNE